jgi:hypothetical protein
MASRLQILFACVLWLVGCGSDYSSADAPITIAGAGGMVATSSNPVGTTSGGAVTRLGGGSSGATVVESTGGTNATGGTSTGGVESTVAGQPMTGGTTATATGGMTTAGGVSAIGGQSTQGPTGGTATGGTVATGGQTLASGGSAGSLSTGGSPATSKTTGGSFAVAGQPGSGGVTSVVRVSFVAAAGSPSDGSIATTVALENVSDKPLELGNIVVRYWLTIESTTAALVGACTASVCGNAVVATGLVSPARAGADHFVEYRLGSGNLAVAAKLSLTFDAHRSDWAAFNELDDYSYPSAAKPGDALERVTVRQAAGLVWGVEP